MLLDATTEFKTVKSLVIILVIILQLTLILVKVYSTENWKQNHSRTLKNNVIECGVEFCFFLLFIYSNKVTMAEGLGGLWYL